MSESQITKLFKYLQTRFDGIDAEIQGLKGDFIKLQSAVDGIAKQFTDLEQEHLMLARYVGRYAKKVSIV